MCICMYFRKLLLEFSLWPFQGSLVLVIPPYNPSSAFISFIKTGSLTEPRFLPILPKVDVQESAEIRLSPHPQ